MKKLLLKLSGELLRDQEKTTNVIIQIKQLTKKYKIGLVIGGGNIFRGSDLVKAWKIKPSTAHNAGMLATIINGLILKDLLEKEGITSSILSAIFCPKVVKGITQERINKSLEKNQVIIFVGGTGNPFFSTDTNACLRAIQIDASEIWKCTKVDGIYDSNPNKGNASILKSIKYNQYLEKNLEVMDSCAIALAKEHSLKIRVFNIFTSNALLEADKNENFGSIIC